MSKREYEILSLWIEKAEHDLIAANLILETNPIILDIACFHYQQAIEKFLKAYLIFKNQEITKTHNFNLLLKQCGSFDKTFLQIDIINLNSYAVRARYPEYIAPEKSEAQKYLQIATRVKNIVINNIGFAQ